MIHLSGQLQFKCVEEVNFVDGATSFVLHLIRGKETVYFKVVRTRNGGKNDVLNLLMIVQDMTG